MTRIGGQIMSIEEIIHEKSGEIRRIAAKHGAFNVRIFGSVARGDARSDSDLDFLVDMEPGRSLLDLAGLALALEDALGRDVDVITPEGLRLRIREQVLNDSVPL